MKQRNHSKSNPQSSRGALTLEYLFRDLLAINLRSLFIYIKHSLHILVVTENLMIVSSYDHHSDECSVRINKWFNIVVSHLLGGMYDFKMKPTISFKFPNGSDERIYNQRTRLAAISSMDRDKEPGSDLPSLLDNVTR
ncbi:hypothetical protein CEXT_251761 [Caerostris extrusa]|uniref:Uncharacterized protein n=1 Tax=Caerostris extrusa TaxID=172846 RepID=A0AAV4QXF1_CAEEX|nr:hypothetical protein CEXT_251761 [Caerostris extrusa]